VLLPSLNKIFTCTFIICWALAPETLKYSFCNTFFTLPSYPSESFILDLSFLAFLCYWSSLNFNRFSTHSKVMDINFGCSFFPHSMTLLLGNVFYTFVTILCVDPLSDTYWGTSCASTHTIQTLPLPMSTSVVSTCLGSSWG